MKGELACIPCIMKQALNTALRATDDEKTIRTILNHTSEYVKTVDLNMTPADASNFAYKITKTISGNSDPYKADKKKFNDLCLEKLPELRKKKNSSDDPLKTAARYAILGNVIDMGIGYAFDLDKELEKVEETAFAADDYDAFKTSVSGERKRILFLGDNAGEIVFDLLLVEELKDRHDVTYVVKKAPIINDSTIEDAEYVGMTDMVKVIDTGSDGIGVKWDSVSREFMKYYDQADIIISKGQGNFETMSGKKKEIYFLLRAKCECVARVLGVEFGDIVLKRSTAE